MRRGHLGDAVIYTRVEALRRGEVDGAVGSMEEWRATQLDGSLWHAGDRRCGGGRVDDKWKCRGAGWFEHLR